MEKIKSHTSKVSYTDKSNGFSKAIKQRLNTYFINNNKDRNFPLALQKRVAILFSLWALLYLIMLTQTLSWYTLLGVIVLFHITLFQLALTAHDGSHNAISRNPKVNKLFYYIFDLTGINSYLWEFDHVVAHHSFPNVSGYDSNMYMYPFLRLDPYATKRKYHQFQHLYALLIYAHTTLGKVFFADFVNFTRHKIGGIYVGRHSIKAWLHLILMKIFAITYIYIIPILVIDAPAEQIILFIYVGHLITGIALGLIFQVTHTNMKVVHTLPLNGKIKDSYEQHIFKTTADFAVNNSVISWITGGLNIHAVHHISPTISQVHLIHAAEIVRKTAPDFQIVYHEFPTWKDAIVSHFKALKHLGRY